MKSKSPLVSISCITYNHESYIRKCLDGFLKQNTSFNFEIIIHDDASTDGTVELVKEYQSKYPNTIFPLIQENNQYSQGVRGIMAKFNFPRCHGKYIALCEGDDYWTDPKKLAKQIEYLESNNNCAAVFHNSAIIENDRTIGNVYKHNIGDITIKDLFEGQYMKTNTLVFRRDNIEHRYDKIMDDTTLGLLLLDKPNSYSHYIDESMAVNIKHPGGLESQVTALNSYRLNHKTHKFIVKLYSNKYPELVKSASTNFYKRFSYRLLSERFYKTSIYCFLSCCLSKEPILPKLKYIGSYMKHFTKSIIK